jgi:riboflavin biosynthesis pyrimidine reductase
MSSVIFDISMSLDGYIRAANPRPANQFLRAGLVDELSIHLAPVLFGDGTRLTESLPTHIQLESADYTATSSAMHLRYRVKRAA